LNSEDGVIFRLSQKLNAKIKGGTLATLPADENPFADWSAGLFRVRHTQYILVTNTKSLYSTVLPGKGVSDEATFVGRAMSGIRECLEADGYWGVYERSIAPLLGTVQFARALNRSVTGSVNDLIKQAVILLDTGECSLAEVSSRLKETPMTGLKTDGSTHGFPRAVFNGMVESAGSGRPKPTDD
jgi:hypothetical protein